eukprot:363171-Chlamydomonas_euryale.AAC.11
MCKARGEGTGVAARVTYTVGAHGSLYAPLSEANGAEGRVTQCACWHKGEMLRVYVALLHL